MNKSRLEAFSDGMIAIIITIMVLELKVPHEATLASLASVLPVLMSYVLSFVYLAIYWNNHHHMIHTVRHVTGPILWANMHLLFWLSLVPFTTGWVGENQFASVPLALYGCVLLMAACAYYILARQIMVSQGPDSLLRRALGRNWKGKMSPVAYLIAIPTSLVWPLGALAIFAGVALVWLVPDRRIERILSER